MAKYNYDNLPTWIDRETFENAKINFIKSEFVKHCQFNVIAPNDTEQQIYDRIYEKGKLFIDKIFSFTPDEFEKEKFKDLVIEFNELIKKDNPYADKELAKKIGLSFNENGEIEQNKEHKIKKRFLPDEINENAIYRKVDNVVVNIYLILLVKNRINEILNSTDVQKNQEFLSLASLSDEQIKDMHHNWRSFPEYETMKLRTQSFLNRFGLNCFYEMNTNTDIPHLGKEIVDFIDFSNDCFANAAKKIGVKDKTMGDNLISFGIMRNDIETGLYNAFKKQIVFNTKFLRLEDTDNINYYRIKYTSTIIHEWTHSIDNRIQQAYEKTIFNLETDESKNYIRATQANPYFTVDEYHVNFTSKKMSNKKGFNNNISQRDKNVIKGYDEFKKLIKETKTQGDTVQVQYLKGKNEQFLLETKFNICSSKKFTDLSSKEKNDLYENKIDTILKEESISRKDMDIVLSFLERHNIITPKSEENIDTFNNIFSHLNHEINIQKNENGIFNEISLEPLNKYIKVERNFIRKQREEHLDINNEEYFQTLEHVLASCLKYQTNRKTIEEKTQLTEIFKKAINSSDKDYMTSNVELIARNTQSHIALSHFGKNKKEIYENVFTDNEQYQNVSRDEQIEFLCRIRYVLGSVLGQEVLSNSVLLSKEQNNFMYYQTQIQNKKEIQLQAYSFGRNTANMIQSMKDTYEKTVSNISSKTKNILNDITSNQQNDDLVLPNLTLKNNDKTDLQNKIQHKNI